MSHLSLSLLDLHPLSLRLRSPLRRVSSAPHSAPVRQSHKANSHAVRFRACQLINKLLGSMAENAQIDDDLFDRIHQAMLVRVTDKFPNVRIQAALAMTRLQQPKDPDCPTINGGPLLLLTLLLIWQSGANAEESY